MTYQRTDGLPERCPKCGAPTHWLMPQLRRTYRGREFLHIRCRCGFDMTCDTNDAQPEPEEPDHPDHYTNPSEAAYDRAELRREREKSEP